MPARRMAITVRPGLWMEHLSEPVLGITATGDMAGAGDTDIGAKAGTGARAGVIEGGVIVTVGASVATAVDSNTGFTAVSEAKVSSTGVEASAEAMAAVTANQGEG